MYSPGYCLAEYKPLIWVSCWLAHTHECAGRESDLSSTSAADYFFMSRSASKTLSINDFIRFGSLAGVAGGVDTLSGTPNITSVCFSRIFFIRVNLGCEAAVCVTAS